MSVTLHGNGHAIIPAWAWALLVLEYLGLLIVGVVVVVRATRRMSRPATIVVGVLGVWTIAGTIAVFLDLDRSGDWRGGALSSSFVVVYGVVGAGVVWAIDRAVNLLSRRTRRATA